MEKQSYELPRSRQEAKEIGSTTYFTGNPCKHGHLAPKVTCNSTCVECQRQKQNAAYAANPKPAIERARALYLKKTEEIKAYSREYAKRNKDKINKRTMERYYSDPEFKASYLMRRYIRKMMGYISGDRKSSQSIKLLPYTPEEFVAHIERMFLDGMTWENHGEWHIDHIVPIAHLIKNGVTDPAKVNCLSNLRPVWASDNLRKGDKVIGLPI